MREQTQLCQNDFISRFPPPTNIDFFLPFLLKSLNSFLLLRVVGNAGNMSYMAPVIGPVWLVHTHFSMHHFISGFECTLLSLIVNCSNPLAQMYIPASVQTNSTDFQMWASTQSLSTLWGLFREQFLLLSFFSCTHTNKTAMKKTSLAHLLECVIAYYTSLM